MDADKLYHDPDLVQFYDIENEWMEDSQYCLTLAEGCTSVLDLGCGTGLMAAALTETGERRVVGVDPAAAMLDVARARPYGDRVRWIEDDARTLRLDERFDLVLMTGHAFQVFLTEADQAAVLKTVVHHLAPQGRFVFDSRNPAAQEWLDWTPSESERLIEHPTLGHFMSWNDAAYDAGTGIVTYGTHYKNLIGTRHYTSRSKIAFPPKEQIARLIKEAGLTVERWLGDWTGEAFAANSPEIIPVGRLKP